MRLGRVGVLAISALLVFSCAKSPVSERQATRSNPFMRHANELATNHGLQPLSQKKLKRGQTEIRIWSTGLWTTGRILQFDDDTGRAMHLDEMVDEGKFPPFPAKKLQHPARACDWPSLLERLTELGVFTLPGESEVPGEQVPVGGLLAVSVDGVTTTFEVATYDTYRQYAWSTLVESERWPNLNPYVLKVLSILNALKIEFGFINALALRRLPGRLDINQVLLARSGYMMGAVKITGFEFDDDQRENRSRGHLTYDWQTVGLNFDHTLYDKPTQVGTRTIEWGQTPRGLPDLSLEFWPFDVEISAMENSTFLVSYPDPESREMGEITRHAYAMTDYADFDEIDYLSHQHVFVSAYVDYEPPCLTGD